MMLYDDLRKHFIQFRKHKGWNQTEAAEICECSQKHISEVEAGKVGLGMEQVYWLYKKAGLNMEWFFEGIGPKDRSGKPEEKLVHSVSELRGEIQLMNGFMKSMGKTINQLVKDFYDPNNTADGQTPSTKTKK